jgi:hypothetical protein
MPEHVHLLVSEPKKALLSKAIQALKLSVSAGDPALTTKAGCPINISLLSMWETTNLNQRFSDL